MRFQTILQAIAHNDQDFQPRPGQCVDAAPGSAAKLRTLQERVERGEELFHPQDRKDCEGYDHDPLQGKTKGR